MGKKLDRLVSVRAAFYGAAWAILPEKLADIRELLEARASGKKATRKELLAVAGSKRGSSNVQQAGLVPLLPIFGTLAQRVSNLEASSGGVSMEQLGVTLQGLVADRAVDSVLLVFDSPGGTVAGTPELADLIRELAGRKPIVGLADSMAASAAYWLLAQCSEAYVSPSGQVGSIGVLVAHQDRSEADRKKGVKTTFVASARYKTEGNFAEPLGEEARAELQGKVNLYHDQFIKAVARGRRTSVANVGGAFGQGRLVTAKEAAARGMVDGVRTLAETLDRLNSRSGATVRTASAAAAADTGGRSPAAALAQYRLRLRGRDQ